MPGWLEDGRQGARALHVTHDRMARLPKVSRLLTGAAGRGLDGTAGIRPRHGGVVRRRLGHRPSSVRRIHPPGHACVDRTAMQVRRTCRMHESEVATEVEGEHAVPAEQQARHVIVGRYDEPPRPLFAPCPPVLVVLPHLPSIPLLPPRPPLPSRPRLSPLSARLLAPEPHCYRHERSWRWRRTPPRSPLPSSPRVGLCTMRSPLCVAVCAFQLPVCPSAFLLRQRSRGLGLGLLLTSPRHTDTRDARAPLLCVLRPRAHPGGAFQGTKRQRGVCTAIRATPAAPVG